MRANYLLFVCVLCLVPACGKGESGATAPFGAKSDAPAGAGTEGFKEPSETPKSRLPNFELSTLEGGTMSLSEHLGKRVILIDFWATYCDPCLIAMPHLNDLYEKYKEEGFVVLGVNVDGPESVSRVRSEVRKLGIAFPILLDSETEVLSLYNPKTSAPYSVLIDRAGEVIKKKEGFSPGDVAELESAVQSAL